MIDAADVPVWLLQAINAQFPDDEPPVPRVTLVSGQTPTADWCCADCWTVYARLDTAYPASAGITQDQQPNGLMSPIVQRWHLGTFMGITGMDSDGNPPDPEAQTADAAMILDTMEKLRCAADTVIRDHFSRKTGLLGGWFAVGPEGDCAGGYWPLSLSLREDRDVASQSGVARRTG